MSKLASKLIAIAKAEVGYLEKKTNSNLDSKTANAGYNNYTKYAKDLHEAGYYQANKNGYAWCDVFVDWCFYQLCGKDPKAAQEIIFQTGVYGAGCKYSAQYYQNAGRLYKTPKVGDQIFFYNSKKTSIAHTGIVSGVDNTYVYTIEGNTSSAAGVEANGGGAFEKKYKLTDDRIYRYGRPLYDEEETKPAEEKKEVCTVEMKVLKKGAKGEDVKAMQILLMGYGFKMTNNGKTYGADGSFGAATDNAVRSYQKANGLSVDGIVGRQTWSKLLGTA